MDELLGLTERLIGYNTSNPEAIERAAGFIKGWLEARGIETIQGESRGLPVIMAEVGPADAPTIVLHGHMDVVRGFDEQFHPRVVGDRLIGRGAYDMKGALASMMACATRFVDQDRVRVRLAIVADEESEEESNRGSDHLVEAGFTGDFVVTGEPTDLHIGVQAKGVLALRIEVEGRAAHGSTPWLGDNAILKAHNLFRRIESLPFSKESSELFDQPSINLGRISGGDAFNKVPDRCLLDVDIRYLPHQDRDSILSAIEELPDSRVVGRFMRPPATVEPMSPFVLGLREATARHHISEPMSIGRDGASDVVSFLAAGVPAVEFGPIGGGHHGPEEWVSIESLHAYRMALEAFLHLIPDRLGSSVGET